MSSCRIDVSQSKVRVVVEGKLKFRHSDITNDFIMTSQQTFFCFQLHALVALHALLPLFVDKGKPSVGSSAVLGFPVHAVFESLEHGAPLASLGRVAHVLVVVEQAMLNVALHRRRDSKPRCGPRGSSIFLCRRWRRY